MYYAFIIRIMYNGCGPNSIIRCYGCYRRLPEVIELTVNYTWRNDFFPMQDHKCNYDYIPDVLTNEASSTC